MSEDSINERLAREMTHEAFSPPEDLGTAQAMIDMVAQEAFPAYGFARSGQDMMSSLKEGDLGWAALAGLGLLPGIPAVTAFHGTPHRFGATEKSPLGEFDASRIGTGEGAQAYGHGFYFAENPNVSRSYTSEGQMLIGGKLATPEQYDAVQYIKKFGGNVDDARKDLQWSMGTRDTSKAERMLPVLEEVSAKGISKRGPGSLYKVDIPDEHIAKMLDWDKPLSEQAPDVRKAMDEMDVPMFAKWKESGAWEHVRGEDLYREIAGGLTNAAAAGGQHSIASSALRAAGITGIRYLDQGSRGSGKGTYNFVVFDPAIAKILERK